jgi:hypothetical protein
MKFAHRLTVAALVLFLCPVLSRVQGKETPSQSPGASQGTIKTKFDSVKNETTASFDQLLIIGTEEEKLLISVQATYATQAPKNHPEDIMFIISVLNFKSYRYPDMNTLIISADGKRLPPVPLLNLDKRAADNYFVETLGTRMKFDVFMVFAKGKNIQMQFAETSFVLKDDHLALLGKFADLLHL